MRLHLRELQSLAPRSNGFVWCWLDSENLWTQDFAVEASPAVSKASPQPSPAKPGRASEQVKSPRSRTPEAKSPPATPRRPESAKKTASKAPSPERPEISSWMGDKVLRKIEESNIMR
eukprot:symbB.v1.2.002843.t1/scaffold144.1/size299099/21